MKVTLLVVAGVTAPAYLNMFKLGCYGEPEKLNTFKKGSDMGWVALAAVAAVYVFAKAVALAHGPVPKAGSLALFLTVWPGMRTSPFTSRDPIAADGVQVMKRGAVVATAGTLAWALLAVTHERLGAAVTGWAGIAVVLTTFHLGISDVITGALRRRGHPVRRLFDDPLLSVTLRDFWSHRWNLAFVEMNRVVFVPWLGRPGAFVLSGLLHELAISLPVGAGFGGPTLYFCLHTLAVSLESRLGVARWPVPLARLWTWCWVLLPLPLLFHQAFRDALVLPLFGGH